MLPLCDDANYTASENFVNNYFFNQQLLTTWCILYRMILDCQLKIIVAIYFELWHNIATVKERDGRMPTEVIRVMPIASPGSPGTLPVCRGARYSLLLL